MDPQKARYLKRYKRKRRFISKWAEHNLFSYKKWDAIAYALLYIIAPVLVTLVSLLTLTNDSLASAYCYFSIALSAANCMYDTFGRWSSSSGIKNLKLTTILISCLIVFIYGLFQFLFILCGGERDSGRDRLLYFYLPAIVVAVIDMVAIIGREVALLEVAEN